LRDNFVLPQNLYLLHHFT